MKKVISITLSLLLLLSLLTACGGGNSSSGSDDPLNRPSNSGTSTPPSGSDVKPSVPETDVGALMGGNTIISGLDEATKQAFIEEAKADGYDVTFNADGSMRMEDKETGEVVIQKSDGSWSIEPGDGSEGGSVNLDGNWPSNDYTAVLPKPDIDISVAAESGDRFVVTFAGVTADQIMEYVEQLKDKGFTNIESNVDQGGMYQFSATNADGYRVTVFNMGGTAGLELEKP